MEKNDGGGTHRDLIATHFGTFHIPLSTFNYVTLITLYFRFVNIKGWEYIFCPIQFYGQTCHFCSWTIFFLTGSARSSYPHYVTYPTLALQVTFKSRNELFLSSRFPGVGRSTPKHPVSLHRVVCVNERPLPEPSDISRVQLEEAILAVLR